MGLASRLRKLLRQGSAAAPGGDAVEQYYWDPDKPPPPRPSPGAPIRRVVDNRVFLIGLNELYRAAIKEREGSELLSCAERVASALRLRPPSVPIEGYYGADADLIRYFILIRALQGTSLKRASEVENLPEFSRLLAVASSPIYGRPVRDSLLPVGRDPLSEALRIEPVWSLPTLTATAARLAHETDDYSLAGLAARAGDPVALTALRESVVLYTETALGRAMFLTSEFVWAVDQELALVAQRFVDAFNALFGPELPEPVAKNAEVFWASFEDADLVGKCVRLGQTRSTPHRYYHWAIVGGAARLGVHEFWDDRVRTTSDYEHLQR